MIEKLDALKLLAAGSSSSIKKYLNHIASDSDDFISAGALCQLIEMNLIDPQNETLLLSRTHIPCVRRLAVFHFLDNGQFQNAEMSAQKEKNAPPFDHAKRIQFAIKHDKENQVKSEADLFLENGQLNHIFKTATYAREDSGESGALPWLIRATLLAPRHPRSVFETLQLLDMTGNYEDLETLTNKLLNWKIQKPIAKIFSAKILLDKDELSGFHQVILSIPTDRLEQRMKSTVNGMIAKAKEKEGNFRGANEHYLLQNNPRISDSQTQKRIFINKIQVTETLHFEGKPLPASNHFMMLGFPRSGTTLLENALASHPDIETFEEKPAFSSMRDNLLSTFQLPISEKRHVSSIDWHNATKNYYDQLNLYSKKNNTSVYIDKMPLNTAFAGLLSRCFPEKRYIFSIRHPYDVVLSCYKQFFSENPAMEHFKRFEDSCALYDFVMKRWFTYFSDDDPRVCYIKYDSLVTDFQQETNRVIDFLNLPWSDDILSFAENAKHRAAQTPSYAKVRQGLHLGVQSSWKNYEFLFDDTNKKHLLYWVEKFGYDAP